MILREGSKDILLLRDTLVSLIIPLEALVTPLTLLKCCSFILTTLSIQGQENPGVASPLGGWLYLPFIRG